MIKSVVWSSMLDYPGKISTVLFVGACNWKCNYCHNNKMFDLPSIDFDSAIYPKLIDRKSMVDTVVISGGEPSVYSTEVHGIVARLVDEGFTVGIHTNGSNPDFIDMLQPYVSFWAMDIKTSSDKYKYLVLSDGKKVDSIADSIEKILSSGKDYEFRTTIYPDFVSIEDVNDISNMLAAFKAKKYVLQAYRSDEPDYKYRMGEMTEMQNLCSKNIWTELRGV